MNAIQTLTTRTCLSCNSTKTPQWYKNPSNKTQDTCSKCYQRIMVEKGLAEGKTCFSCSSSLTPQWFKNPLNKTQDACRKCYQRIRVEKGSAEGKTCFSCSSTKTTTQWYKNPLNKTQDACKRCYQRIRAEKGSAEGKSCFSCNSRKTSQWYKNPLNDTQDACQKCYQKIIAEKGSAEGKSCFSCNSTKTTSNWHKNPSNKTQDACNNCYRRIMAEKHSVEGKSCFSCNSTKTPQWYKNPLNKNQDACHKCYDKISRKRKREGGLEETSLLPNRESEVIRSPKRHYPIRSQDQVLDVSDILDPIEIPNISTRAQMNAIQTLTPRTCFSCNSRKTPKWYKNPLNKNQDACKKCYDKISRKRKREGGLEETSLLPNRESEVIRVPKRHYPIRSQDQVLDVSGLLDPIEIPNISTGAQE